MNKFNKLNLKGNPFRVTPANNSKDIIWAGFPDLKKHIGDCIKRSINIPNTSLVLNWGDYGSGKTHALRYFGSQDVLAQLSGNSSIPYYVDLRFPKSKEPVKELFFQVIDKLDLAKVRKDIENCDFKVPEILPQITDNIFMQKVFTVMFGENQDLFKSDVEGLEFKSFLYGTLDYKKYIPKGIIRKFASDNDYIEFLAVLFSILTYEKKAYSCVILWIDEFEDIQLLNSINISNVNNFVRTLIDKCSDNLLIFLNLTLSAMMSLSDLGEYLQEAVRSRIIDRIEFQVPNSLELKKYLEELLNEKTYRLQEIIGGGNKFTPFTSDVIDTIIEKLGDASLRKYNEVFSMLIETAVYYNVEQIDSEYFEKVKDEIMIWE